MEVLYFIIGVFIVGPLIYSAMEWPRPAKPAPRPRAKAPAPSRGYYCLGAGYGLAAPHYHLDGGDADRCMSMLPPPVPADKRPAPCPLCHHNHFSEMCPGEYKARTGPDGGLQYISLATGEVHEVSNAQRAGHPGRI